MNKDAKKVDVLLLTETNFILDITFEQSEQCERLFSLALNSGVPVVISEYSFAEAEGKERKHYKEKTICYRLCSKCS